MTKNNDKRLCWNCEGNVSYHIAQCPYCGVDVNQPVQRDENVIFKNFASPFQPATKKEVPQPPYANRHENLAVTEEEWKKALDPEQETQEAGDPALDSKKEMIALLLLLPGVVFLLFGLALILFSDHGILVLRWKESIAYFYFLGAIPLLYLGWRALRKQN